MRIEVHDGAVVRFCGAEEGHPLVFLHAFGDGGHCYAESTGSSTLAPFQLIVPDLWGFGASPRRSDIVTVADYSEALVALIQVLCPGRRVGLVGHSIAGSMAVEMANRLGSAVSGVFSIEGNLTPDDAMFTGRAADFEDPVAFKDRFLRDIWEMGEESEELRHYYSGARMSDAVAMWHLGRDAKRISAENALGEAFRQLSVPKLYYWSATSTPQRTADWIEESAIPKRRYERAGHWPMVSQPEATAEAIADFFSDKFP